MSIEAHGISVRLGGTTIVNDVSLRVEAGELVALVGPNGAGKSTLLAALAGDLPLANGEVRLLDRPLPDWNHLGAARLRCVQTQQPRVSFAFTSEEVVRMGRAPWRETPETERDDEVVAAALHLTECLPLATRRITSLSGGESARVTFSRSLAQEAVVMLLDEPTAALDLRHQELELQLLRQRTSAGVATVVVLHDLSLAGAWADRVILLQAGRIIAEGSPTAVLLPELLSQAYQQPVTVIAHPHTGTPVVLPARDQSTLRSIA